MKLINYLKGILFFLIPFIVLLFIITIFYYFDLLSNQSIKYFKIIILLLSCLSGGFYIGRKSQNKGYLNGIILSGIILTCFFLINLFLGDLKWQVIIYYLIIVITTTIGSMIGINQKSKYFTQNS